MKNGVARIIATLGALVGAFAGVGIDFGTHTHVFNPEWPPHARYHAAMLVFASLGVSIVCLLLIFGARGTAAADRTRTLRTITALLVSQYLPFFLGLLVPGASAVVEGTPTPLGIPANVLSAMVLGALFPVMYALERRAIAADA